MSDIKPKRLTRKMRMRMKHEGKIINSASSEDMKKMQEMGRVQMAVSQPISQNSKRDWLNDRHVKAGFSQKGDFPANPLPERSERESEKQKNENLVRGYLINTQQILFVIAIVLAALVYLDMKTSVLDDLSKTLVEFLHITL